MSIVRLLCSPRLWGILFILLSLLLTFQPLIARGLAQEIIIAGLVIMGVVIVVISLSAYQVENSREFVLDNLGDGLFIAIQSGFLALQVERFLTHDDSILLALIVAFLGWVLAVADLLVSTKNGSNKLMEMDRDRVRTEM